jgi:ComF family protein
VARCRDCPPAPIGLVRSPFLLAGPVRTAVHRLKFAGWRPVALALGRAAAEAWEGTGVRPDVVTWVPLSRRRRAERGFDQAEELASVVARRLGLPARPLLERCGGDARTQARRDRAGRLAAMQGRFRGRALAAGSVLLVDDVLTTGATAAACADALLRAGADRVDVLTAARALRLAEPGLGILASGPAPGSVVARGAVPR